MKSIEFLEGRGIKFKLVYLSEAPKTAKGVEQSCGAKLHQVLKTLVFAGNSAPVIAVVPGDKRVDIEKLRAASGQETLRMASPEEVKEITGIEVGGVTPFGVEGPIKIIDQSIFNIKKVNIGSGKAEIGIELDSAELKKAWHGKIAGIV